MCLQSKNDGLCGLEAGPDGELPEALQKLDPNILELVCNEILDQRAGVQWEDIAGQDDAKRLVQELVVWPMLNPHLFQVRAVPLRSCSPCSYIGVLMKSVSKSVMLFNSDLNPL